MKSLGYLVLPVILAARVTFSAELGTNLPPRPFHLERTDGKRWDVTFTLQHGPFHGIVYYPVPPDDPSQTIESVDLQAETNKGRLEGVKATDASPLRKPLLKLELQAEAPFTVVAHVVVQFYHTTLETGAPAGKVKSLDRVQQKEFLDDGLPNDSARQWFTQWMKQHQLIRNGEDEAEYSFRVLKFVQKHFRYVIPDNIPEYKAMVAKYPEIGDWYYTIKTSTGECWRLSNLYDCVMRMNGIPARLVSGNWLAGDKGHHVRSLIYLREVGWVPVEATSAMTSPNDPPMNFFGAWGEPMLNGNRNLGYCQHFPT
jgi:hypothetical protein